MVAVVAVIHIQNQENLVDVVVVVELEVHLVERVLETLVELMIVILLLMGGVMMVDMVEHLELDNHTPAVVEEVLVVLAAILLVEVLLVLVEMDWHILSLDHQ